MRSPRRVMMVVACLGLVLAAVAGLALRYLNTDTVRGITLQRLRALTDRQVTIQGDFDLVPSLTPTVAAEGLRVANAPWGSQPTMLHAERIEVKLRLLPLLLRGEVRIDRLVLVGADLLLETGAQGQANWRFNEPAETRSAFILSGLSIRNSRLTWHDTQSGRTEAGVIDRLTWQANEVTHEGSVSGKGQYRSRPFTLSGRLGRLGSEEPYTVALQGTLGDMEAQVEGRVSPTLPEGETRLEVTAAGPQLVYAGELFGASLPPLGPYRLQASLVRRDGKARLAASPLWLMIGDAATVQLVAQGRITDVLAFRGVQLQIEANGDEVAAAASLAGIDVGQFGPYTVEGTIAGSRQDLRLTDLVMTAGDEASRLRIAGTIAVLPGIRGFDLTVEVAGVSPAALAPLIDWHLPPTAAYRLGGRLSGTPRDLRVGDIAATVADSVVRGWLAVRRRQGQPAQLEGELTADRLNLEHLMTLATAAADEAEGGGLVPGTEAPLPLGFLTSLEAHLAFRADELLLKEVAFENARLAIVLQDGRLSVQDITLQVAGGSVVGAVAVAAGPQPAVPTAEIGMRLSAQDIDVAALLTGLQATPSQVSGKVDIDLNINSTGGSVDELIAALQGSAAVVAEEGSIGEVPLYRLVPDLDILTVLPSLWEHDRTVRVNCLIAEFDIEAGVAQTEAMLDTPRLLLLGEGTVNLGEARLDLALRPVPQDQKLSRVPIPVDIEGPLTAPEVKPQLGQTAGHAIRGIVGGLLVPLNQITALFGKETADACAEALRQAQEQRAVSSSDDLEP